MFIMSSSVKFMGQGIGVVGDEHDQILVANMYLNYLGNLLPLLKIRVWTDG